MTGIQATGRGLNKGLSKYNKQGLLDLLGGEGSIHLTAVPEFKYLESVRNLMQNEKGHWAQKARQKAEAREQEKVLLALHTAEEGLTTLCPWDERVRVGIGGEVTLTHLRRLKSRKKKQRRGVKRRRLKA